MEQPVQGPSARLIAAAEAAIETIDKRGRRLCLRQLGALDKLRLFKAAGPVLAQNPPWLGMALLACSVTAVDGVPVPMPGNETQIEGRVQLLGDDGIAAVAAALEPGATGVDVDAAKN